MDTRDAILKETRVIHRLDLEDMYNEDSPLEGINYIMFWRTYTIQMINWLSMAIRVGFGFYDRNTNRMLTVADLEALRADYEDRCIYWNERYDMAKGWC
jgi:hypothetical protein